jgi:hypothetical protein
MLVSLMNDLFVTNQIFHARKFHIANFTVRSRRFRFLTATLMLTHHMFVLEHFIALSAGNFPVTVVVVLIKILLLPKPSITTKESRLLILSYTSSFM